MSFLLCHKCYSWVVPRDVWCPECRALVDPGIPDPPMTELASELGTPHESVLDVRCRRRRQVLSGRLIRTTQGLLFSPLRETGPHGELLVDRPPPFPALSWLQAFTDPFWPWLYGEPSRMAVPDACGMSHATGHAAECEGRHAELAAGDEPVPGEDLSSAHRLVRLLMKDPGACFVPLDSIRVLRWQRTCWILDRCQGARWQLMSASNASRLEALLQRTVKARQSPCVTSRILQQQS